MLSSGNTAGAPSVPDILVRVEHVAKAIAKLRLVAETAEEVWGTQ
jgi:hypothetical protein